MGQERHFDVLLDGQPGKEGKALKHNGGVWVDAETRACHDQYAAFGRPLQAGDDAQQGAFPTTRGPQQGNELSLIHAEVDVLKGDHAVPVRTIHLVDVFEVK